MNKNISPEMYNFNKFPGPSFARVDDKIVAEEIEFQLIAEYKDGFDQLSFSQRFSQLMLKYDYIVGDWGNDQLRLKGFYKEDKHVKAQLKLSHVDDYLTEFCSYGCAYFILENPNPKELELTEDDRRGSIQKRRRQKRGKKGQPQHIFTKSEKTKNIKERSKKRAQKQENREILDAKRGFVIRQK